jgi:SAM-dependent methyltransferase
VPWTQDAAIVYEHFHRYLWAARLLAGRRVLDLGSGEGFGAAILASRSPEVVGVDIDAAAVEHASANYGRPGLSYETASALELSRFERGSFGAVVAFEMIEHVADHERLLAEIAGVLAEDGLLLVSTPDRDLYSEAAGQENAFHVHELTQSEFRALLHTRFEHVAMWGQRTVAGSLLSPLDEGAPRQGGGEAVFLASDGGEWTPAQEPQALFCVALASRRPLPAGAGVSVLADPGLELRREVQRAGDAEVAERDRLLKELNESKTAEVLDLAGKLLACGDELWATRVELDEAQQFRRRVEESVAWQGFQRARGWIYGVIGEDTRAGRALQSALRRLGRG